MVQFFKKVIVQIGAVLFAALTAVKLAFDWVGRSTLVDDWDQLVNEKLPEFLSWLFQTPWWVPGLITALLCGWLMYVTRPPKVSGIAPPVPRDDNNDRASATDSGPRLFLNVYGFTININGIRKLWLNFTPDESIQVSSAKVLYNRPGGNESFEFESFDPPKKLVKGEKLQLTVLHHRNQPGAFWGREDDLTAHTSLNGLSEEMIAEYNSRYIRADGPYYCRVVISAERKEYTLDFTMFMGERGGLPAIIEPGAHKDFDPNRITPMHGTLR